MANRDAFLDSLGAPLESRRLAEWAAERLTARRLLDLGCGNGAIAFSVATCLNHCACVVGLDVDSQALAQARFAARPFAEMVPASPSPVFMQADARSMPVHPASFGAVLCNPPFFSAQAARPSPDPARQRARQDQSLSLQTLLQAASDSLVQGGALFLVLPAHRQGDLRDQARTGGFEIREAAIDASIRPRKGGVLFAWLIKAGPVSASKPA